VQQRRRRRERRRRRSRGRVGRRVLGLPRAIERRRADDRLDLAGVVVPRAAVLDAEVRSQPVLEEVVRVRDAAVAVLEQVRVAPFALLVLVGLRESLVRNS